MGTRTISIIAIGCFAFLQSNSVLAQQAETLQGGLQIAVPTKLPAFGTARMNSDGTLRLARAGNITETRTAIYTVDMPVQEEKTVEYEVQVPYTEKRKETYTVEVPYLDKKKDADGKMRELTRMRTEERTRFVPVTKMRTEKRTRVVPVTGVRSEKRLRQVPYQTVGRKESLFPIETLRITTINNVAIDQDTVVDRLQIERPVLILDSGQKLDPYFSRVIHPSTLVIRLPEIPASESQASGKPSSSAGGLKTGSLSAGRPKTGLRRIGVSETPRLLPAKLPE